MLTWIERIRIGMPPMICGTRVRGGGDLGVERVDVDRDPHDHGAVVIGAGERRGDRDQRERRAFERARQVHPPDRVEGVGAGAGGDVGGPDLARAPGSSATACSVRPGFCAAAAIEASGQ